MGSNPKLGVRKDECKEILLQVNIGEIGQVRGLSSRATSVIVSGGKAA